MKNSDENVEIGQTEECVPESEEKYRTLFSSMSEGFALHEVICDEAGVPVDYRFLEVNAGFEAQTGLRRDDVVGKTLFEILPDSEPSWVERYGRIALTGESARFTDYSGALDKWYEVYVFSPSRGRFAVLFTDITERKVLEDTQSFLLQCGWPSSGEDFFLSLARYLADTLSMDFVCIDRLSGDCLSANTVALYFDGKFEDNVSYSLKDTPCGDVVGETICCFPRDVRGLFPNDDVLQDMMAEGYVGTTLWNSKGEPIGLIALISRKPLANPERAAAALKMVAVRAAGELERTRTEEVLQGIQEDLKRAQSVARVGSWRMDVQRNVLEWSEEIHRIFGVPEGTTMTYETFLDSVHPDDREDVDRKWVAALQGEHYDIDHRIIVGDTTKWVRERAELEFDSGGGLIGGFGTVQDITERKQSEEKLKNQVLLLQRAIAPTHPPVIEGYSSATAYIPAFTGEEIGGDFYDIFHTESGMVGILIGDVSGKGIEAAALASEARNTVRAFAYQSSSPSTALSHANSLLARNGSSQFATVFLIILDPATGEFTYSGGGHPPALICRCTRDIELLKSQSIPIGLFEAAEYSDDSSRLDPGDKLVLYTDGVSEARRQGDFFGHAGVVRTIDQHCADDPNDLTNRIISTARDWADGHLADDAAVVLVARD